MLACNRRAEWICFDVNSDLDTAFVIVHYNLLSSKSSVTCRKGKISGKPCLMSKAASSCHLLLYTEEYFPRVQNNSSNGLEKVLFYHNFLYKDLNNNNKKNLWAPCPWFQGEYFVEALRNISNSMPHSNPVNYQRCFIDISVFKARTMFRRFENSRENPVTCDEK